MVSRPSLAERAHWPPVLDPEDLATVLGLSSARAAKEFIQTHGIPCSRLGQRVFVLSETLVAFLREREAQQLSRAEQEARADETVRQIAPTARQRERGRKPPRVGRK